MGAEFVNWREEYVSQERGRRVVHYYLEDVSGVSHLAVVGTERSVRHMWYVVCDEFRRARAGEGAGDNARFFNRRWRSRREVVNWLACFLPPKFPKLAHGIGDDTEVTGFSDTGRYLCQNLGTSASSDIIWSGSFWTCGKQLRHYQAFCRNRTTITTHSFVLVMSEVENRYLAYLEDMYEDKKGQKKVKVRWFHQNQEFACTIPPPAPHPSEVFITAYSQVISVECVDDIATVLTPEHYEKCLDALPPSAIPAMRFCFRQYSKNKFKKFDLKTLRGYFSQAALLSLGIVSEKEADDSENMKILDRGTPTKIKFSKHHQKPYSKCLGTKICRGPLTNFIAAYQKLSIKQPARKPISVKVIGPRNQLTMPYVGDKMELLCQDSGIRGCWFRCTVIKACDKRLKVQYEDVQDADNSGSLEEWVPAYRLAAPDNLGLRCPGRLTIRPCPPHGNLLDGFALVPGSAVDAWRNDGWWEGVVVSVDTRAGDNLEVYFPGEDIFMVCQLKDLRISKDWVKNQWIEIEPKPDVLSHISSSSDRTRLPVCLISKGTESSSFAMSNQEVALAQAISNEEDKQTEAILDGTAPTLVEDDKQSILGKRPRDDDEEAVCNVEIGVEIDNNS